MAEQQESAWLQGVTGQAITRILTSAREEADRVLHEAQLEAVARRHEEHAEWQAQMESASDRLLRSVRAVDAMLASRHDHLPPAVDLGNLPQAQAASAADAKAEAAVIESSPGLNGAATAANHPPLEAELPSAAGAAPPLERSAPLPATPPASAPEAGSPAPSTGDQEHSAGRARPTWLARLFVELFVASVLVLGLVVVLAVVG